MFFLLANRVRGRRKYLEREQSSEYDEDNVADEGEQNVNLPEYDAYVVYNHQSDAELQWVLQNLLPNIEEGPDQFKLCVGHARDFLPGVPISDNIIQGIQKSRKTILLLTPSFMQNEWNYFETQQAQMRLIKEHKDILILILLEEIPDDTMTLWLRRMLMRKDYLKWPGDDNGQQLFWECLRLKLRTPTRRVDRRYDM